MNEIIEKLKDIISSDMGDKRVFDKDVAEALGMSKALLSQMKKNNSIPYEQITKFCAKRKISINWILFDQLPKSLEKETEKYTRIKHFTSINASAGGGCFNYDEDFEYINIDKKILDSLYKSNSFNIDSIIALNVIGDSMQPTINDKEMILFNKDSADVRKGGVFVVSTNAGLFVKRVVLKLDGSLELISDNKTYNPELISKDEIDSITILGKVIGKVSGV